MAQIARVHPLPDSGRSGPDEGAWLHDLTPTLSDVALFDAEGAVLPLATRPVFERQPRPVAPLRLVVTPADDRKARASARHRSAWR